MQMFKGPMARIKFMRVIALSLFIGYGYVGHTQDNRNFSKLKNADLRQCPGSNHDVVKNINRDLGASGLPAWGSPMGAANTVSEPSIDRFTITEDREMEFTGEINFSGLSQGTMNVIVSDMSGKVQKEVNPVTLNVDGTSGLLDVKCKLNTIGLEPNTPIQSGYIKLEFQPSGAGVGKTFCFILPKKWKVLQRNEDITINITAQPFKTSEKLIGGPNVLPVPGGTVMAQAITNLGMKPEDAVSKAAPTNAAPVKGPSKTPAVSPNTIVSGGAQKDSSKYYPQGVANRAVSLFGLIRSDVEFTNPADISPILFSNIYYDKNPLSGIFYYMPNSYNLNWDAQSGFQFKTIYNKGTETSDGTVNMTATLNPGVSANESGFINEFMAAYSKSNPEIKFKDLTAILPQNPKISLEGNLQNLYGIKPENISVSSSTSIYDPITASWSASTDAANEILTALGQGVGITGDMSFKTDDDGEIGFTLPVKIGLANNYNFGKINLKQSNYRTEAFSNKFPYPIQLTYLHVMIFNEVNGKFIPCVYTWSLGNKTVLSKSKIKIDATAVPGWIDNDPRVKKIWVEYALQPCMSCTEEVVNQISSGSSGDRSRVVKINSMGLIRKYNVSFMKVVVRSRFLDPKTKMPFERSFTIDRDNTDFEAGPFYVWNEKDLSYEYKVIMLNDEKTYEGNAWIPSKGYELYVNKDILKRCLGDNMPSAR